MTKHFDAPATDLSLTTADGTTLAATFLPATAPRLGVLISPATGYPRRFYLPFAQYLASRGANVLLYDYRGIRGSAVPDLARSGIDIQHWGRFDLAAAAAHLSDLTPDAPLTHVAHSVGGHLVGMAENHAVFDRHAFLAVGSGYWGHHQLHLRPMEFYFWWALGGWSLWRHGYLKTGGGWAGEPLPPQAFRTWRRWSHRADYLARDLGTGIAPHWFDQVRAPIQFWSFSDDPIATPRAVDTIRQLFTAAQTSVKIARPADYDLRRIGHDGAFRKGRETVWSEVLDWMTASS